MEAKKAVFEHDGEAIEVEYLPITRLMRDEALEAAAIAFYNVYGKEGYFPSVYLNTLARRIIVKWSLPVPPKEGWDRLTDDGLVDKLLKETGIEAAHNSLRARATEAEKAKNL